MACWLERDPKNDDDNAGHFQQFQQGFSSLSATAENENAVSCGPDSNNGDDCTNNSVLKKGCFQQNRNNAGVLKSEMNSNQYLHNLRSAENEKRSLPGTAQLDKPVANSAPCSFSSRTKDAESVLKTEPVAEKPEPARSIDVRDYKKLESSEPKTACYVCGRKGS